MPADSLNERIKIETVHQNYRFVVSQNIGQIHDFHGECYGIARKSMGGAQMALPEECPPHKDSGYKGLGLYERRYPVGRESSGLPFLAAMVVNLFDNRWRLFVLNTSWRLDGTGAIQHQVGISQLDPR